MTSLADKCFFEGLEHAKKRNFEEAESKYKQALAIKPDHSRTLLLYGLLLQNQKMDYEAVEELWMGAAKGQLKNKYHVQMVCNLAVLYEKIRHDYDQAERFYKIALDANPMHANTLVNYGTLLAGIRQDYERADQMFRRAIKADPTRKNINNCGYLLQEILAKASEEGNLTRPKSPDASEAKSPKGLSKMASRRTVLNRTGSNKAVASPPRGATSIQLF